MLNSLKAQAGKVRSNLTEVYTFLLIAIGLPLVAYVYVDWKAALTVFVVSQIVLGFLALRSTS